MKSYWDSVKAIGNEALPWDKLDGCNILVAGATGLLGGCLVDALMSLPGIRCRVFAAGRNADRARCRFSAYWDDERFEFLVLDVCYPLEFNIDFHYIINAASDAAPGAFAKTPVEVVKANVFGVCNLVDYGRTHRMRRFLYISTGEIYGEGSGTPFRETDSGYVDCATPRACYPSSKRAAETLCVSYGAEYGVDTVIARLCHTYGPHFTESDNRVYAQFIRNVLRGEDILMKSDGSQYRSWCYVVDAVRALLFILMKGESGNAYNVADPDSCFSIRQLALEVASSVGRKVIVELPDEIEKKGFSVVNVATFDISKLLVLGYRSDRESWQEKLKATIIEQERFLLEQK